MVAATQQGTLSQSFSLAGDMPREEAATLDPSSITSASGGTQGTYTGTAKILRRPLK